MAIAQSPNSKASVSAPIDNKRNMISGSGEEKEIKSEMKPDKSSSQPQKRNKTPVIQNGATCHQCRHKTYAVYASCKNHTKTKPCTLKYCRACLLNRYGEKAEDVALLDQWDCPKCRGVCNCSICMKKRGHQPTGMLGQMAKAGGFSSASDLIHVKGTQNVSNYKRVKETCASPRKPATPAEGIMITSPKKPGKENLFDGKTDSNANPLLSVSEEKPKKIKRKAIEVMHDGNEVSEIDHALTEKNPKKLKSQESNVKSGAISKVNNVQQPEKEITIIHKGGEVLNDNLEQNANQHLEDSQRSKVKKNGLSIYLPAGSELINIAGVELPKEDAGNALQLLEFCATFGKILDVKKGQAEAVLRDLIKGRSTRRGKYTSVIQFQIQLLSVIQAESETESESEYPILDPTNGNDSWLKALKSCISKSKYLLKELDCIDIIAGGCDDLDSSMKLKILLFLSDEVLGTEKVRNWIDDQNAMFDEKRKEAKDKLSVAKEKEKFLKQKMQDEVAKAIIARDGVPLTILEHDAIVYKTKKKAAEARAEMLACKTMIPIDKERPDAMRKEPIYRDNNGHVYWRLNVCSDKPDILLQDIGNGDDAVVEPLDKWFQYDAEQMDLIEKHINVLRSRSRKGYKNHGMSSA